MVAAGTVLVIRAAKRFAPNSNALRVLHPSTSRDNAVLLAKVTIKVGL